MKLIALLLSVWWTAAVAAPEASLPYQRSVIREMRFQFGLDAPVAIMAGQIEQESAWNPAAQSPFAQGLAQFTPSTAAWISGAYPATLSLNQPFNPDWALRAMAQYDALLYKDLTGLAECEQWAMTLSAYNGGAGWVSRDRRLCGSVGGCDPDKWYEHVELHSTRSPEAFKENRGYPRRIMKLQANYISWGRAVTC